MLSVLWWISWNVDANLGDDKIYMKIVALDETYNFVVVRFFI